MDANGGIDAVNRGLPELHATIAGDPLVSDKCRIGLITFSDIAEELVRLESHVAQFSRLLEEESPGRSLDFLSQELAREANTIASKSVDVAIAHMAVDLKTHIERLREQIQNIE
jgi:uncharacterized protein (TIGR00255 family)